MQEKEQFLTPAFTLKNTCMDNFKLGVGPMSHEINDIIDMYAVKTPLLVVASRNQVDYKLGYVCHTSDLPKSFSMRSNILLCRDHCGPYFKDSDKSLTVEEAIIECKKTIDADIAAGFDLIHIDVSRIPENQFKHAQDLIEYTISKNPLILMEFGSEQNTGTDLAPSAERIDEQLDFISDYKDHIKYFVTQTGSFTQHTQVGTFDVDINKRLVDKVHSRGFRFKEHNADYLSKVDVALRNQAGVDTMNIAPQLGTIQTRILFDMTRKTPEWDAFAEMVYSWDLWNKWMPPTVDNWIMSVIVAGHYHFNTQEYQNLLEVVDRYTFEKTLKQAMYDVFNIYTGRENELVKKNSKRQLLHTNN